MQMIKRNISALLLCLVLLSVLVPASAAADTLDTSRPVTLTVNYRHEDAPVAGVHFDIYITSLLSTKT